MNICKKHPTYKALRKPRADCPECEKIYKKTTERIVSLLNGTIDEYFE